MKTLLPFGLMVCLISLSLPARAADAPFVSGFDRFFRDRPGDQPDGGNLLLSELSCTACHATSRSELAPKRGPVLDGTTQRLSADWLRKFLKSPQTAKPGTTMPDVLHSLTDAERDRTIEALLAFLSRSTLQLPELTSTALTPIAVEFWRKGDAARGRELYHRVGCVACHEPDDEYEAAPKQTSDLEKLLKQLPPEEIEELGLADAARPVRSVPHSDLDEKYSQHSLAMFLLDPALVRPAGRMPGLKLDPGEAADLVAYLLRKQTPGVQTSEAIPGAGRQIEAEAASDELAEQGRKLFTELGCAACHDVTGIPKPSKPLARPLAELRRSGTSLREVSPPGNPPARLSEFTGPTCFDRKPGTTSLQPRYELDEPQITAILAALPQSALSDPLALQLLQLNCFACHERGQRGGVGPNRRRCFETAGFADLGDEGRLPPPLDGVGRKLKETALQAVFKGTGDVRSHLLARMPLFPPQSVNALPKLFRTADLGPGATQPQPDEKSVFGNAIGNAATNEAGRQLLDTGCVQCHPIRGERLPGVLGIDLAGVTQRIEPLWFQEFLRNPGRVKARTRMPTFFPNGRSANQTVLGGEMEPQIAALWSYLRESDKLPLPDKIEQGNAHNFELVATDRPIILRTFMKEAGTHAIAVAFPEKVNLAFNAEQVRIAQFWRGSFLNAHGTWYDRFAPLAEPLGTNLISLPPGVPFAVLDKESAVWPVTEYQFRGYRIDKSGVPAFLYRFGVFDIEDRFEPAADSTIRRRIRIATGTDVANPTIWFRALSGKTLRASGAASMASETGLRVTLEDADTSGAQVREQSGQSEWLIPLRGDAVDLEILYQW